MERTIKLGRCTTQGDNGSAPGDVEVQIKLGHHEGKGAVLSICASVWQRNRRDMVAGGQMEDSLLSYIDELAPGVTRARIEYLLTIWRRWHLNDMRAGCEHQRAEKWDERRIDASKPRNSYGKHFEGQRSDTWNMLAWVRPDEHPDGLLGKSCPTCGYRYGTAWLVETLPANVEEEVKRWIETGSL
jgi:hypothetical protein